MKQGCIKHIPNTALAILRADYLAICDDDKGAALLLSQFEYFHDIKIEKKIENTKLNAVAERHGDEPAQDVGLYQFYTAEQLGDLILGGAGRDAIEKGLLILVAKGFVSIHKNPNPRYKFDSTRHFLFRPDEVNEALDNTKSVRSDYGIRPTVKRKLSNGRTESVGTSPKTTPENTKETTVREESAHTESLSKQQEEGEPREKRSTKSKEGNRKGKGEKRGRVLDPPAEAVAVVQLFVDRITGIPHSVPPNGNELNDWLAHIIDWQAEKAQPWEVIEKTAIWAIGHKEFWGSLMKSPKKLTDHWNAIQDQINRPKGEQNGKRQGEPKGFAAIREWAADRGGSFEG